MAAGMVAAASLGGIGKCGYDAYKRNELPAYVLSPVDHLPPELPQGGEESLICAADRGITDCDRTTALGRLANTAQEIVPIAEIAPLALRATVDTEDRRFEESKGVDARGILRAIAHNVWASVKAKRPIVMEGGSGITRQTVNRIYPQPTATELQACGLVAGLSAPSHALAKEVCEGRRALAMEQRHSKDYILEKYVNVAYTGRGRSGYQAGSQAYFYKDAKDLTPIESIILPATLSSPSAVDMDVTAEQLKTPKGQAKWRREHAALIEKVHGVINDTLREGHISPKLAKELRAIKTLPVKPFVPVAQEDMRRAEAIGARNFMEMVKQDAAALLGINPEELSKGYIIHTTLNTKEQNAMNHAIKNDPHIRRPDLNGAGVAVDREGRIIALVGSKNFQAVQTNLVTARRDVGVGSTLKPFAYAANLALRGGSMDDQHEVPAEIIIPKANGGQDWKVNFGNTCRAQGLGNPPCKMADTNALARSDDIRAAQLVKDIGIAPIAETARALGADIEPPYNPSLIFGSAKISLLGLTRATNSLVLNKGIATETFAITKITDKQGNILYEHEPKPGKRVVNEEVANGVIQGLKGVLTEGTAKGVINMPGGMARVAGKTGTAGQAGTKVNRGLLFVGSQLEPNGGKTATFWIGRAESNIPFEGVESRNAAELWARYIMTAPHSDTPGDLAPPAPRQAAAATAPVAEAIAAPAETTTSTVPPSTTSSPTSPSTSTSSSTTTTAPAPTSSTTRPESPDTTTTNPTHTVTP